jgi:antitoxin (DNA-binding transcriptional repressor) of toxin-antitoxin stability system
MRHALPSPPRPVRLHAHGHRVSSERRHFCRLSLNVRPVAIASPTLFIWVVSVMVAVCKHLEGKARLAKALTQWTNWTNVATMKTVNVHEAKTNFSSLLATVEDSSESFVICRNGEPVADLVPHKKASRLKPHPVLSKIKINYDPTEPLSENEWPKASR